MYDEITYGSSRVVHIPEATWAALAPLDAILAKTAPIANVVKNNYADWEEPPDIPPKCDNGGAFLVYESDNDYHVLLVHGRDSGMWGIPKGGVEYRLLESCHEAWQRELYEETGILLRKENVMSTRYASLGRYFYIVARVNTMFPIQTVDTVEVAAARWVPRAELSTLPMNALTARILNEYDSHQSPTPLRATTSNIEPIVVCEHKRRIIAAAYKSMDAKAAAVYRGLVDLLKVSDTGSIDEPATFFRAIMPSMSARIEDCINRLLVMHMTEEDANTYVDVCRRMYVIAGMGDTDMTIARKFRAEVMQRTKDLYTGPRSRVYSPGKKFDEVFVIDMMTISDVLVAAHGRAVPPAVAQRHKIFEVYDGA